jgi:hypothetical protein
MLYHPDKWDPVRSNMTIAQSTEHFQLLNNAQRTFVKLFETKLSIFLLYERYSLMLVIHGAKA